MEAFDGISSRPPLVGENRGDLRDHNIAHEPGDPVAIVIDPSGKLHYQTNTTDDGHRTISILGDSVSDAYLLSGVPSIFEYHGQSDERPASRQSLRHISTQTIEDGFIWARYLVEKASSPI